PGPPPAEQADHDEVGAVEETGQVAGGEPGGVAEPVGFAARPGAEQIRVRRGQQQNDGHAEITSLGVLAPCRGVSRRPESPGSRIDARPGLPTRTGSGHRWGSLPGDSGGTAPDSHRLPPYRRLPLAYDGKIWRTIHPVSKPDAPGRTRPDACPGALQVHEAADGPLARVRLPGGLIRADQLRVLADCAATLGNGVIELTSRGNVQVRGLSGTVPGGGSAAEAFAARIA